MKFKIDQNLSVDLVTILEENGHDAMTVWQQNLGGAPDPQIVAICQSEERVLITADLDLSDIRGYPPERSSGYIVFRLKQQSRSNQITLLRKILPMFATSTVAGQLWIVEETRVRVRGTEE